MPGQKRARSLEDGEISDDHAYSTAPRDSQAAPREDDGQSVGRPRKLSILGTNRYIGRDTYTCTPHATRPYENSRDSYQSSQQDGHWKSPRYTNRSDLNPIGECNNYITECSATRSRQTLLDHTPNQKTSGMATVRDRMRMDTIKVNAKGVPSASIQHYSPLFRRYHTDAQEAAFSIGDIIWAPWVVSSTDEGGLNAPNGDNNVVFSSIVGPICGKCKPLIIYAIYKTHLLGFPINTSGGAGMSGKQDYVRTLCLPILQNDERPIRYQHDYHYLRCEPTVLRKSHWQPLPGSYINVTEPYNLSRKCPYQRAGKLIGMSTTRLRRFLVRYLNRGMHPPTNFEGCSRLALTDAIEEIMSQGGSQRMDPRIPISKKNKLHSPRLESPRGSAHSGGQRPRSTHHAHRLHKDGFAKSWSFPSDVHDGAPSMRRTGSGLKTARNVDDSDQPRTETEDSKGPAGQVGGEARLGRGDDEAGPPPYKRARRSSRSREPRVI